MYEKCPPHLITVRALTCENKTSHILLEQHLLHKHGVKHKVH